MLSVMRVENYPYEINKSIENYKYIDLSGEKDYFAFIEPVYPQLCKIEKINADEMIISYFSENSLIKDNGVLDLLKTGSGFSNQTIRFEKIYDKVVGGHSNNQRECRIRFTDIDYDQAISIDNYINNIGMPELIN